MSEMQPIADTGTDVLGIGLPPITGRTSSDDYPYNPPTRELVVDGQRQPYDGPGVVNRRGELELFDDMNNPRFYYPRDEAVQLYYSLPSEQKMMVLDIMERKGYQTGTAARDINALEDLLITANRLGRTWDVTLRELDQIAPDVADQVAAPRYRVSSRADITEIANQVAQRTIGRSFREDEVQKFVAAYQGQEVGFQQRMSGAGVVEDIPSVDVAAEQFAEQIAPTEANAYKFLGAIDMLRGSIGAT